MPGAQSAGQHRKGPNWEPAGGTWHCLDLWEPVPPVCGLRPTTQGHGLASTRLPQGPISTGSPGSSGHLRARLPLSCASTHFSLWLHWTHPEESPDQGGLTGDTYQMFKEEIAPVLPNLLQKAEGRTPPQARSPSQASITLRPDEGMPENQRPSPRVLGRMCGVSRRCPKTIHHPSGPRRAKPVPSLVRPVLPPVCIFSEA